MAKCPSCGFEADNFPGNACPQCGKKFLPVMTILPWLIALSQSALVIGFMLAFHFPRPMMFFFVAAIFLSTAFAGRLRRNPPARTTTVKQPPPPFSVQALTIAIGAVGFALLASLLFGFVMFMNSWESWHRYRNQDYHTTTFHVIRPYYQPSTSSHGSTQIYASGMVEGRKEWMNLQPYLTTRPHDQDDLDRFVPPATVIPVYLFPDLKGYGRVQLIGPLPPAETNYKQAMLVLNRGMAIVGILGAILFVLVRLRRSHLPPPEPATMSSAARA